MVPLVWPFCPIPKRPRSKLKFIAKFPYISFQKFLCIATLGPINRVMSRRFMGKSPVTFASWFVYCLPQVIILLAICWAWLQVLFIGFR